MPSNGYFEEKYFINLQKYLDQKLQRELKKRRKRRKREREKERVLGRASNRFINHKGHFNYNAVHVPEQFPSVECNASVI